MSERNRNAVPVKGGGKPKVEHVKLECTIESSCEGETRYEFWHI